MRFYNPTTEEVIDKKELCRKFNTSIPLDIEEFNGYYALEDDRNTHYEYNSIFQELSDTVIVNEDGKYKEKRNILDKDINVIKHLLNLDVERKFEEISKDVSLESSLGFEVNANDIALRNINGLIDTLEDGETCIFRLYNNEFKELTKEELYILKKEIILNGQYLYKQKWDMLSTIKNCTSIEELKNISIKYTSIRFDKDQ